MSKPRIDDSLSNEFRIVRYVPSLFLATFAFISCSTSNESAQFRGSSRQVANRVSPKQESAQMVQAPTIPAPAVPPSFPAPTLPPSPPLTPEPPPPPTPPLTPDPEPPKPLTKTFPAAELIERSLVFDPANRIFNKQITLQVDKQNLFKQLSQVSRPSIIKKYLQGSSGTARVEEFAQANLGVLDIQIVIDESLSMGTYVKRGLLTKLSTALVSGLQESDWTINVTSTDPRKGCSKGVVRRTDLDPGKALEKALGGTLRGSFRGGIAAAVSGLNCTSPAWLRPGSTLAVIIVSDQGNCGSGCRVPNTEALLLNTLNPRLQQGNEARVYGVLRPRFRAQYANAIVATNGVISDITASDFSPIFGQISSDIGTILKKDLFLKEAPSQGTAVKVSIDGREYPSAFYAVRDRKVSFTKVPPLGSKIKIEYSTNATPLRSRFPLGERPADGTLVVSVNGGISAPNTYTFDETSKDVIFSTLPPSLAEISLAAEKDVPLETSFEIDSRLNEKPLSVFVDGKETKNYEITSGGNIAFEEPPPPGALIDVNYFISRGPLLTYKLNSKGSPVDVQEVVDAVTGLQITRYASQGGSIVFDSEVYFEGRKVKVKYKDESSGLSGIVLSSEPVTGTLSVSPSVGSCVSNVTGDTVDLNCTTIENNMIQLKWIEYGSRVSSFTLDGVTNPEEGEWVVTVNDVPLDSFNRNGSTISVNRDLRAPDIVKVTFKPKTQIR